MTEIDILGFVSYSCCEYSWRRVFSYCLLISALTRVSWVWSWRVLEVCYSNFKRKIKEEKGWEVRDISTKCHYALVPMYITHMKSVSFLLKNINPLFLLEDEVLCLRIQSFLTIKWKRRKIYKKSCSISLEKNINLQDKGFPHVCSHSALSILSVWSTDRHFYYNVDILLFSQKSTVPNLID